MNKAVVLKQYIQNIFNAKKVLSVLLFATLPGALFYTIAFNFMYENGYETMEIIRDFAQQMEVSSFLGFLSSIGTWLWVSSTAIAFFGALTINNSSIKGQKTILILLGIFSIMLAIDDFFMIHDRYIDQNICYGLYAFLALILFIQYLNIIVEINGFAFFLAGTLLALSILTDIIQDILPFKYEDIQIVEEGLKFTGASTWLYFVASVAAYQKNKNKKKKK